MIKILVTRPEPGLSEVMHKLKVLGKEPIALPMLNIETLAPLEKIAGNMILVISIHALPALKYQDRTCRLLAVGKKTGLEAKKMGFEHVFSADGNAQQLKSLFLEMGGEPQKTWLAAGCGHDGRLYGDFLVESLAIRRFKTYQVKWRESLSQVGRDVLTEDSPKQILFYSSETVRAFLNLMEKEERENALSMNPKQIEIFCFSKAIAKTVRENTFGNEWANIEDHLESVFQ